MNGIKDYFKGLMDYTSRMTASQVMMLFGVVAGTIVGIFFIVGWVNNINYAQLYSNLDENEAGEVVSYLADNKIPYNITNGGNTIEIPSDEVYKTRIALASQGMPRSGNIGYSVFDQNNLGMTDFLQNLNFRRALEGELTKTIMQLNEVQAARVHIVMPKERLFKKDKQEASASVVLKLKGGGLMLSKQQINGITHLVASSVEGLKPSNIAIVDYDGNLLTSGMDNDPLAGLSSSQLEVRKQVESYLEGKAQSMMDDVLGMGRSVIRVTADLNFQQIERTSEIYDPNAPSVRSEEKTKTNLASQEKAQEDNESTQEDNSETTITNYELNKTVEHIVNAIGSIDRISVAVMVDGIYTPAEGGGSNAEMIYQPRNQEDLDRLASIVKNAVGFDNQRNDQIEMINIAFDRQNLQNDQVLLDQMYQREFYMDIAKKVGYFLLLAFMFLYFKKKSKKLFAALGKIAPPKQVVHHVESTKNNTTEEEEFEEDVIPEKRKPKLVDKMQKTAKEEPEEIAKVIKTMMVE